jgi:hypothetical protein
MDSCDAEMAEVTVILDRRWEDDLPGAIKMLENAGLRVIEANDENSVVQGDVEACKLHDLERLDCVDYVRKVFTWSAEYPKGDPRDRNQR